MPMSMLAGGGDEYRANLLEQGLRISPGLNARNYLHEYLAECHPAARARAVTRVGWQDNVFVLPNATFGPLGDGERVLFQSASPVSHAFNTCGTLSDWRREIAALCVGNSRLMFAVSTGFAAPLLYPTGDESGGFHFVGPSSLGKTTALRAGASVWGGSKEPMGYLRQWRVTANGLEAVASQHCDSLLPLDELGQVSAREAGEVAYLLSNGSGKSRARRDGSARPPFTWRILFLSSGEITIGDKSRKMAGSARQRVRRFA
jgi:putative DNA primase/helicase